MVKIINLILYSQSKEYDDMRNLLRDFYSKTKGDNIKYFFYCYDENIKTDYVINDDIIYIKGKETYLPGIFQKTIRIFEICLQKFEFDYIIRSNISTVVDYYHLENYLEKTTVQYGGAGVADLQWLDPSCGIYDNRYKGTKYIFGTGIILNKYATRLLVTNKNKLKYDVIDDVGIGVFLNSKGIFPQQLVDSYKIKYNYDKPIHKTIFYRNKRSNRNEDVVAMKNITKTITTEKRNPDDSQTWDRSYQIHDVPFTDNKSNYSHYGTSTVNIDVLSNVMSRFVVGGRVKIPSSIKFNDIFGDPIVGHEKELIIQLKNKKIVIYEERDEDIDIELS